MKNISFKLQALKYLSAGLTSSNILFYLQSNSCYFSLQYFLTTSFIA